MNIHEIIRDKFIFFIFLSILIHFLIFSFYQTLKNNIPSFEVIEITDNKGNQTLEEEESKLEAKVIYDHNTSNPRTKESEEFIAEKNGAEFLPNVFKENNQNTSDDQNLPRRHTVSAETKDPIYAEYVEEWRRKVEIIGNLYYPQELALKEISGDLLLDAAINKDGQIKSISILRSSGNEELDKAAINIVKLASPFKPLPEKIIKETDILHIIRTWKFSNK